MRYTDLSEPVFWEFLGFWDTTIARWKKEGLSVESETNENTAAALGLEPVPLFAPYAVGYLPPFPEKVIEETEERIIWQNKDGIILEEPKTRRGASMPRFIKFPVETREDFRREVVKRYDLNAPGRYDPNWDTLVKELNASEKVVSASCRGYFGYGRHFMGLEKFCTLFYDDPAFVEEIFEFITDNTIQLIEKALKEVKVDYATFWEDMAYKTGSLISPAHFRKYMLPNYKRVVNVLHKYGVDLISVDSDGNIDELIPLWLEAGVNIIYPMECAAGMDVVELRKKYGKDLRMIGGISKAALASGKTAIDTELQKKIPVLLESGGYIPCVDHAVPHDVSLDNYIYYLKKIRSFWAL
jgi:uroporphyrinogen decarboxylase